jgi:hypothetical protein
MSVTIGGAVRYNKLYAGKQVRIVGKDADLECRGKVIDANGDTMFLQLFTNPAYPFEKLLKQEDVTVIFVVPEDAAYSFTAVIHDLDVAGHTLQLEQTAPMERVEQRSDYRLKTSKLIYVALGSTEEIASENWEQASLLNISRGGASILTRLCFNVGDELKVWIPLEEVDHIIETGIRVVRVVEGEKDLIILGVSFTGLPLPDQAKILDYILKVWTEKKDEKSTK